MGARAFRLRLREELSIVKSSLKTVASGIYP